MNMLQFEFGLIPIKVTKEHKASYIMALEQSHEEETLEPFRAFMIAEHIHNLQQEIAQYKKGITSDVPQNVPPKMSPQSTLQESIIALIAEDSNITRQQMASALHVSVKTIARTLSKMDNVNYVGPSKGGHWEITQ